MQFISAARFKSVSKDIYVNSKYKKDLESSVTAILNHSPTILDLDHLSSAIITPDNCASSLNIKHKIEKYSDERRLTILIASDRGLCGGYNNFIKEHFAKYIINNHISSKSHFITIGNKSASMLKALKQELKWNNDENVHSFNMPRKLSVQSMKSSIITPILNILRDLKIMKCDIIYSEPVSSLTQEVRTTPLIPIQKLLTPLCSTQNIAKYTAANLNDTHSSNRSDHNTDRFSGNPQGNPRNNSTSSNVESSATTSESSAAKAAESSATNISHIADSITNTTTMSNAHHDRIEMDTQSHLFFTSVLHEYFVQSLYFILLKSQKSEHSARMHAMDTAHRNSSDLIKKLELMYNSTRQMQITKELIEIISGNEAISNAA